MYALSLGFIIFISVAASLQIQTIEFAKASEAGAYHTVNSGYGSPLNRAATQLEDFARTNTKIKSFTWVSKHLQDISQDNVSKIEVMNLGQLASLLGNSKIYAVSPSIFKTALKQFLVVDSSEFSTSEVISSLYHTPMSAILTSAAKDILGVKIGDQILVI